MEALCDLRLLLCVVACIIVTLYSAYPVPHLNIQAHKYFVSAGYVPCVLRSGEAKVTKTESAPCPPPVQWVRETVREPLQDREW